jgi:hypothetical protein
MLTDEHSHSDDDDEDCGDSEEEFWQHVTALGAPGDQAAADMNAAEEFGPELHAAQRETVRAAACWHQAIEAWKDHRADDAQRLLQVL